MRTCRFAFTIAGLVVALFLGLSHAVPAETLHSEEKGEALKIVIDPGHGGKDSGAISSSGVREKDITLALGKDLASRLKGKGFEVLMTREGDTFIPLSERTGFANRKKADLFVSIHVNANDDSTMRGVETYFLSLNADASSVKVAARENSAGVGSSGDLQFIINDLILNGRINESSLFASSVQKGIVSSTSEGGDRFRNNGVKQAYFHVLVGAQMPSILVETGFITNPSECRKLQEKAYQEGIVSGILAGITNYAAGMTNAHGSNKQKKPSDHI